MLSSLVIEMCLWLRLYSLLAITVVAVVIVVPMMRMMFMMFIIVHGSASSQMGCCI